MVRALLLLTAATLLVTGCGGSDGTADGRVRVVATTGHVADLVRNVVRDRTQVTQLLDGRADPHDYEPRPSDARALAEADVVFAAGGEVDAWLGDLVQQSGGDARRVTLIEAVRRHGDDPHWWQDVRNAQLAVARIRDELVRADPAGAKAYRLGARTYGERLIELDAAIADCIDRISPGQRKLVTTHDALGYYARRYGLEVVGATIPSLSTQAQPSAAATERLIRRIRSERVPAVFPESAVAPKLERAIAREANARVAPALYTDTLGPEGSAAASYVGALEANTRTIAAALSRGRASCSFGR